MNVKIIIFFNIVIFCILFNACASIGDVEKIDKLYYQDNKLEESYKYSKKYVKDDFLWSFQSGILGFQIGDFKNSINYLNIAETYFENNAQENIFQSTFKTISTILISNGMFAYYGNLYETVFVNYYKALNFMMLGDYVSSRVEFNRANDRQRRSKEFFSNKINQINTAINDSIGISNNNMENIDGKKTFDTMNSIYLSQYKNLDKFKAYDGYVNPMVSYVSGIFFLLQNDFNKANDLLKEAYAISYQDNILDDISLLNDRKQGKNKKYFTWIFIEDGQSPKKNEIRFDVPLYFINSNIFYFNMAFPKLDSGKLFNTKYYIKLGADNVIDGFELSNMESIIANEFSIEIPYIIMTSLISSAYKVYLQHVLSEKLGVFGGLGGAIFSTLSTNADIRSSRILPLRFLALRVENKNQIYKLFGDDKLLYNFQFDNKCQNLCINMDNIIYIRVMQNGIISTLIHAMKEQ